MTRFVAGTVRHEIPAQVPGGIRAEVRSAGMRGNGLGGGGRRTMEIAKQFVDAAKSSNVVSRRVHCGFAQRRHASSRPRNVRLVHHKRRDYRFSSFLQSAGEETRQNMVACQRARRHTLGLIRMGT